MVRFPQNVTTHKYSNVFISSKDIDMGNINQPPFEPHTITQYLLTNNMQLSDNSTITSSAVKFAGHRESASFASSIPTTLI